MSSHAESAKRHLDAAESLLDTTEALPLSQEQRINAGILHALLALGHLHYNSTFRSSTGGGPR